MEHNGTLLNENYIKLFDQKRNLLPVLSIKGRQEKTDERRGGRLRRGVEFVPVTEDSRDLAPGEAERGYLRDRLAAIREEYSDMVFISFPGDEKSFGGCLAAGRGFFHINSHGGAEPCPFSPYSDINVKTPLCGRRCAPRCLPPYRSKMF